MVQMKMDTFDPDSFQYKKMHAYHPHPSDG